LGLETEILKCFRAGILVIDMSGVVVYRNEIAKKILSIDLVDVGGNLRYSSAKNAFYRMLLESLELKYLPSRMEAVLPGKEGRTNRMIGFTLAEFKDVDNTRTGICAFFKDLTHVEMAEENRDLDARLRLLGQMAAGLAHEIRNPITSIGVHCGLLRLRHKDDSKAVASLSHIESEIGKIESIIRECLNFVRPAELCLNLKPVRPMLEQVADEVSKIYPKVNVSFQTDIEGDIIAEIDEVMFEQAIRNIVMNGAQACSPENGGDVVISARLSKGFWDHDLTEKDSAHGHSEEREYFLSVSIKDNGSGIPESVRDKLFVPFFTTKKGGTGIGLSIVQKIVSAHKGVLDIISEEGQGTEFIVKIPMRSSNA